MDYAEWSACERFGILPSNIAGKWDENNVWSQAKLLAYDQIRSIEDASWNQNNI